MLKLPYTTAPPQFPPFMFHVLYFVSWLTSRVIFWFTSCFGLPWLPWSVSGFWKQNQVEKQNMRSVFFYIFFCDFMKHSSWQRKWTETERWGEKEVFLCFWLIDSQVYQSINTTLNLVIHVQVILWETLCFPSTRRDEWCKENINTADDFVIMTLVWKSSVVRGYVEILWSKSVCSEQQHQEESPPWSPDTGGGWWVFWDRWNDEAG